MLFHLSMPSSRLKLFLSFYSRMSHTFHSYYQQWSSKQKNDNGPNNTLMEKEFVTPETSWSTFHLVV